MHRIECECGTVRGSVEGRGLCNHLICYCPDCRAFARFLGCADDVLDAQGGTEIVQVAQPRVQFVQGVGHLSVVRLSENGILRWYAGCCATPIGNTLASPKIAVIGLIHTCLDRERINEDFGRDIAIVNTANAAVDPKPRQRGMSGVIVRSVAIAAGHRISGRYRASPLFDEADAPIATARILAPQEWQSLRSP